MSKFQIILLSVFGVCILGAVLVFALSRGSSKPTYAVNIWGPFTTGQFESMLDKTALAQSGYTVTYSQVDPATFDTQFTNALAENRGPDLVVVSDQTLWQEHNRLSLIPYTAVNQNDYTSTFAPEASLFTTNSGIYALPFLIDPMVLYTNSDLLSSAGIVEPLKRWVDIYTYVDKLTTKDPAGNVTQSTMALGEASNVPEYKDILSLLMIEAGTPITAYDGSTLVSAFLSTNNLATLPSDSALDFYTQFANPSKPFYSWNRALPDALMNFISGNSAMYLGFASELPTLEAKNPNLNLLVTPVPQSDVSKNTETLGRIYGFAVVKNGQAQAAALNVALSLVASAPAAAFAQNIGLPPARRDLLSARPAGATDTVFYTAAVQAKGWLDPNPQKSASLFSDLIESVTSGRASVGEALSTANGSLNALIKAQQ